MLLRLAQLATFIFVTGWTIQVSMDNHLNTSGLASALVGVTAAVGVTLIWETFRRLRQAIGKAAQHIQSPPRQGDLGRIEPYLYPPEARDAEHFDLQAKPEWDDS